MFKRKTQMNTAELHIHESAVFAAALVGAEKKSGRACPYAAVARRLEDCSRSKIWSLVHRPRSLKSIASHIREGLASAYAKECDRQRRLLEHEIAIAKAIGVVSPLLDEASALVGNAASVAVEAGGA